MQDRASLYPGRVKLIPVTGQENTYDMVRADEPTQEGTPINKYTLLQDEIAALLGLSGEEATVNNALAKLFAAGRRPVIVTVTTIDGLPVPNVSVSGILTADNLPCVTSENGKALGFATDDTTILSVTNYIDLTNAELQISTPVDTITSASIQVSLVNYVDITSSQPVYISGLCTRLDVCAVGAGGNGGPGTSNSSSTLNKAGGGGGGGDVVTQENVAFTPGQEYMAVVGASGGGSSSLLGVEAVGGANGARNSAGAGNGNGGAPLGGNGQPGTKLGFVSFTDTALFGGGGGGGSAPHVKIGGAGGSPFGGVGGSYSGTISEEYPVTSVGYGAPGTGYGGGGGGGGAESAYTSWLCEGGSGYQGKVACRMWH